MKKTSNIVQFPANKTYGRGNSHKGWSYLLSDSLAFNKDANDYAICMQKPSEENIPSWITKIISAGQCDKLYVENLELNESEQEAIEKLCEDFNVKLFNVCVNIEDGKAIVSQQR